MKAKLLQSQSPSLVHDREHFTSVDSRADLIENSVVFVHGLQGNRITSWSKSKPAPNREPVEENGELHNPRFRLMTKWFGSKKKPQAKDDINVLWPKDLLPQKIRNIRILTYGYDSQLTQCYKSVNKNGIYQYAENLLHALTREPVKVRSFTSLALATVLLTRIHRSDRVLS